MTTGNAKIFLKILAVGAAFLFAAMLHPETSRASAATSAAVLSVPYDPVPEIGAYRCGNDPCHWRRDDHRTEWRRGPQRAANTVVVDCSARDAHAFHSITDAMRHTPTNGTILIRAPGSGATCVETVNVTRSLTIAGIGGVAVIQAPKGASCLKASLPLGDPLTIDGVKLIARGDDQPCVDVQAGEVVMRNSRIDSRNTDWAFNVRESASLKVDDTEVETDGSGVYARRANVDIHKLSIDTEQGHDGVGLELDRTDGSVKDTTIIGGMIGMLASPGSHGLDVSGLEVHDAKFGVEVHQGQQGWITMRHAKLAGNFDGLVATALANLTLDESTITGSAQTGVASYGAVATITNNQISGGIDGILLGGPRASVARPAIPLSDADLSGWREAAQARAGASTEVAQNGIELFQDAGVKVEPGARGSVHGNTISKSDGSDCIDDTYRADVDVDDNTCTRHEIFAQDR